MSDTIAPSLVDAFQMAGQDVPWLVAHWAQHKPDHPFLIWEPRKGEARRWTYAEFETATRRIGAASTPPAHGWAAPRVREPHRWH